MEIYRIKYKQLCPKTREAILAGDKFVQTFNSYHDHEKLLVLPTGDRTGMIEPLLRKFCEGSKDERHWLYIVSIELIGSALGEFDYTPADSGKEE